MGLAEATDLRRSRIWGVRRPRPSWQSRRSTHTARVEMAPHEAACFGDNYLDLAPGERRTIAVTNRAAPLSPEDITLGWR